MTVTTSADSNGVTVPVNTPATFTADATAGTPQPNPAGGWVVTGGPAYQWNVTSPVAANPANSVHTTITVPAYTAAGTYTLTINCAVTYQAKNGDGLYGSMSGNQSKTVTVYVIGGPITGDQDEYFFCSDNLPQGNIDALGYLYAAPNQPAGTTYSWSISGHAIYCDADGHARTPTEASTRYRGTLPGSSAVGDVTANVTYSLNGVSAKSSPDFAITVHVPATFTIKGFTPAVKLTSSYGFSGQSITFEVRDSVKQLYPPGKASWSESWTGGQPPNGGGAPLDDQSRSVDSFSSDVGLSAPSDPNDPYGDRILGPLTHVYAITHIGGTGGLIGCPIQTYTDVYYYTYQMTGNGFAAKK